MSPPCVAHFEGNNGGATAPGVTENEVIILIYRDREGSGTDEGPQYIDFGKPETEEGDGQWGASWRAWQQYFNDRYQTYGRFVHIWYQRASDDHSAAQRRADVADADAKLNPFAIVAVVEGNGEAYVEEWARRGKPVFRGCCSTTTNIGVDQSFYRKYPGKIWSFRPSMQQWAEQYGGFLCGQIAPHPVSFAGDASNGQPRRIGLLGRRGDGFQNEFDFGRLIRSRIESCGGTVADEQYYEADDSQIPLHVASMRRNGVTTIVFTTGLAIGYSTVVGETPWRPEWILQEQDNIVATALFENQEVFRHARHLTTWPRAASWRDRPCQQAEDESGEQVTWECIVYPDALLLFTGIQVAGPRLTAQNMDQGFHRIPAIQSQDPRVPSCFFKTGDYTCVKDAQRQWWDPTGRAGYTDSSDAYKGWSSSIQGCWKSMSDGRRYLADSWPSRDLESYRNVQSDGCNVQGFSWD